MPTALTSASTANGSVSMRKDAERNRERLIEAASALMRAEGGDIPMEVIAERAGVTRGTLYRNFAHRQAMYEAVLERDLLGMTQTIAAEQRDDPLAFIRRMAELMTIYDKFLVRLANMPDYDAVTNETRMTDVLAPHLAAAQQAGVLRPDLNGSDVLMACRMLASHWKLDAQSNFAAAFDRRLSLLLVGLCTAATVHAGDRS